MIFILDHYYTKNHKDYCGVIEINKTYKEIEEITSAIEFLFEDTITENESIDIENLVTILCTFYGAKKIDKNKFKDYINTIIDTQELKDFCSDKKHKIDGYVFTYVDLYMARENCCGPDYLKLYDKWLPKNEDLEKLKTLLKTEE